MEITFWVSKYGELGTTRNSLTIDHRLKSES